MITLENYLGAVEISEEYFTALISHAVSTCFGVVDMNLPRQKRKIYHLLRKADLSHRQGVSLAVIDGRLAVSIHITVLFGTNIKTVTESLAHKVRYTVEDKTGVKLSSVSVYIDGIVNH